MSGGCATSRVSLVLLLAIITGFQSRDVTSISNQELEPVVATCNLQEGPVQWIEAPRSDCSKPYRAGGTKTTNVYCQKIITIGDTLRFRSVVADKECFDVLGNKPKLYEKYNQNAINPTWFTEPWKPCNKLRGEGKQTRKVVCRLVIEGKVEVINDIHCLDEKPATEQPCMRRPSKTVDWVISSWTGCDTCLSRTRTRHAECVTTDRAVVNSSFCSHHKKPILEEDCRKEELPPCQKLWFATQWSPCSVMCGKGIQVRRVFCGVFNGTVTPVNDSECSNLTKYNDTKPCEIPNDQCPAQWHASHWAKCSKECGIGEQYRRVMCIQNGKVSKDCRIENVLDPTQSCNHHPCDNDSAASRA